MALLRLVTCGSRVTLPFVFSSLVRVEILPSCMCSRCLLFFAYEVTGLIMDLHFWEGNRKAALTQKTRKDGRSSEDLIKTEKIEMHKHLCVLVFFAGAAVRLPFRKRKCIIRRVTSQAKNNKHHENMKEGRIFTRTQTNLPMIA